MKCLKCNKEVSPEFNVCPWCGYKPKKCSKPEHQNVWLPEEARFCPRCGESLSGGNSGSSSMRNTTQAKESTELYRKRKFICIVCGYVMENDHNIIVGCPVCNAPSDKITELIEKPQQDSLADNLEFDVNGICFTMVYVEGGSFQMGDKSGKNYEMPVNEVALGDYYIGETQVTQALWKAVVGKNPSYWKGNSLPVENVSWNDCQEFIKQLNKKTGKTFRLPTEAEWVYAARGGHKSQGFEYAGSNDIGMVAWFDGNSRGQTHPVKQKSANELGLYDMSGNVWEWCQDWNSGFCDSAQTNPSSFPLDQVRVLRGGSWFNYAMKCRVTYRKYNSVYCPNKYNGFRLVLGHQGGRRIV